MMHKKLDHVKWTAGARVTLEKMYRVPQGSGGYQTLAFFCGLTHMGACECGWVCVRGLQKPESVVLPTATDARSLTRGGPSSGVGDFQESN